VLKKIIVFALIINSFYYNSLLKANSLSKNAYASILTCSPGEAMYSAFGHTAIRIKDSINDIDVVYNFGTFDFNTSNFYIKFSKGTLLYQLDEDPYYAFEYEYESENRSVREQVLNLTQNQLELLYCLLQENLKPENKFYKYDIFYDNCSTRVRDLLEKVLGQSKIRYFEKKDNKTFRELLSPYLENKQWTKLGIDLLLGLPIDKTTNRRETCFLPYGLYEVIGEIQNPINNQKLVLSDKEIISKNYFITYKNYFSPELLFWTLLIIIIIFNAYQILKLKNNWLILSKIIFSIVGFYGLLILTLMLWSEHASVSPNLNIVWSGIYILPFYWFYSKKLKYKWMKIYYVILLAIISLFLLSFYFLPQKFNFAVLPIILILFIENLSILISIYFNK